MHTDLTQGAIKTHIRALAIPASVGFFFHTMFNVTDTWFAGTISTQALAALSLSFPIFFLIISVAGGMAEGITALVGNALGEGRPDAARHIALNALAFGGLLAALLTFAGNLAAPLLMESLGAEGAYLHEAVGYISIIILGTLFFVFTFFINAMLNAMGDMVSFRNVLTFSAFLNIVLDYWFIKGGLGIRPMGVEGIALATVIIEALSLLYLWYRLARTPLFSELPPFRYDGAVIRELVAQGTPPSLNMALTAIGIYIITYFAAPFGKEVVAAYGIGMRIEQIMLMPAIGLNVAVLAIVAQNNGAERYDRVVEAVETALSNGVLLAILGGGVLMGASDVLMELFSDNRDVIAEGARYLRIEALIIYPFIMIFIYLAMLQGIKRPRFIFYISLIRQVIAPVAVLALLAFLGQGVLAIWLGIASIVAAAALVTRWFARRCMEELRHRHGLVRLEE